MTDQRWAPAERFVPELVGVLMHMSTESYAGVRIEQYKHVDTRRYLNLDASGQAWQVRVSPGGEFGARRISLPEALEYVKS